MVSFDELISRYIYSVVYGGSPRLIPCSDLGFYNDRFYAIQVNTLSPMIVYR